MIKKETPVLPQTHANVLIRANGLPKARRIAESCMKETHPDNYVNLPKGFIANSKDKKQRGGVSMKFLLKNHRFWTDVFYILKKKAN